jgi:Holliday junction resolvasome RuvABC endonuclease subunit
MNLAIDPGGYCGYALGVKGGPYKFGVWNIKPGKHDHPGVRYVKLFRKLKNIKEAPIRGVYYERAHHRGAKPTEYHYGCIAIILLWAWSRKIPARGIHSKTIKKHATGDGNATKLQVIESVLEWIPKPITSDEADALALLDWSFTQE